MHIRYWKSCTLFLPLPYSLDRFIVQWNTLRTRNEYFSSFLRFCVRIEFFAIDFLWLRGVDIYLYIVSTLFLSAFLTVSNGEPATPMPDHSTIQITYIHEICCFIYMITRHFLFLIDKHRCSFVIYFLGMTRTIRVAPFFLVANHGYRESRISRIKYFRQTSLGIRSYFRPDFDT